MHPICGDPNLTYEGPYYCCPEPNCQQQTGLNAGCYNIYDSVTGDQCSTVYQNCPCQPLKPLSIQKTFSFVRIQVCLFRKISDKFQANQEQKEATLPLLRCVASSLFFNAILSPPKFFTIYKDCCIGIINNLVHNSLCHAFDTGFFSLLLIIN